MPGYKLLYLTSLVTFTFGGLTFSILALYYWREQARRKGGPVFATFTAFCAAAFLVNLLLEIAAARSPESRSAASLTLVLEFVTSLLPPLLAHVIYSEESERLPWRRTWWWTLCVFYGAAILTAAGRVAHDSGRIAADWTDSLDSAPVLMLAAAGVMGLFLQIVSRRTLTPVAQSRRFWTRVLLCLTVLVSAINVARPGPFVSLLPDYLVLGFFCVTVYYNERLVFFDFLIKRGLFFALALVGLTSFFAIGPEVMAWFPDDWSRPWIGALLLMPFWMMAPRIYGLVGQFIDRVCLRRRYTPVNAERQFIQDIQTAATENDLRRRAAESLSGIFQTRAEVHVLPSQDTFDDREDGLVAPLDHNGARLGCVTVEARPDAIPFLSDDRRLLQSLARTLGVVLENVRFREQRRQQEEREQQLRLLASRAELKALRAQINPHFLFNALNAIAGLIQDQPRLADETVEQLAQVFRYTLRKSQTEWVRLDEELEFVRSYLRVEQARFGERLRVEFDVDPALSAIPIPTMTIQPLVENAVKHGVSRQGSGKVVVRARLDKEVLQIEVCDNGPGFPAGFALSESMAGHGLHNVSERIAGYYDAAAPVRWETGPYGTTGVTDDTGRPGGGFRGEWPIVRVLIVDDEAPARTRLRQILASQEDLEIAGEADTGIQAMELAEQLKPDVILLDIQMPGCSGIDVAASLPQPRPHIIFCTAFDQHAVDAFELHAVDYLLKPISRARLAQALERARSISAGVRELSLDQTTRSRGAEPARFLVRSATHYIVVGEARVLYFCSEGGLTRLIGEGGQFWMDPTLNDLENRLDPRRFFRISRAALINLNAVAEVHPLPGGSGEVLLKNGQRLEVSRRRFRDLLQSLEAGG